jgi:hypothetical protein
MFVVYWLEGLEDLRGLKDLRGSQDPSRENQKAPPTQTASVNSARNIKPD